MRLIVTGYAQHGKDTACEILRDRYGMKFVSSSYFVMVVAVAPYLAERGIVYNSPEEMYADRVNHRPAWKKAIEEYNTPDASRLGRMLFEAGNDVYCGLRDVRELKALTRLREPHFKDPIGLRPFITTTIWVDALKRKPPEPETSITIKQSDCAFTLDNNGTLEDLSNNVDALWAFLKEGKLT